MIVQSKEAKSQPSLIDLLGTNSKSTSNDLFGKLLNTYGYHQKDVANTIEKGEKFDFKPFIDLKSRGQASDKKVSRLIEAESNRHYVDNASLSKEFSVSLSDVQKNELTANIKTFLVTHITKTSSEYQIKELPKSLPELMQLAQKMGIEPKSITPSLLKTSGVLTVEIPENLSKTLPVLDENISVIKTKTQASIELFSTPVMDLISKRQTEAPIQTSDKKVSRLIEAESNRHYVDNASLSKEFSVSLSDVQKNELTANIKTFLVTHITKTSSEYQTKELPKSLPELMQLAQKMGIEPKSITPSLLKTSGVLTVEIPENLSKTLPVLDENISVIKTKTQVSIVGGDTKAYPSTSPKEYSTTAVAENAIQPSSHPLLHLLQGEPQEIHLLSSAVRTSFTEDQLRAMIHQAKDYLKNEISLQSPEYQSDTNSIPKSLIGLVQLAHKLGLEPESITLSTLKIGSEERNVLPLDLLSKPLLDTKMMLALSSVQEDKPTSFEAIAQLLNEVKKKDHVNGTIDNTTKVTEVKGENQSLKTLLQSLDTRMEPTNYISLETGKSVENKASGSPTPKSDLLITLLQGEQVSIQGGNKTDLSQSEVDFSKPIPGLKSADSIDVKAKEAQQSMRHFASDLKEAIQDYKPPFTRLTMKLNPEKLGEVEVTLVHRGNNVHVNIQSPNTASVAFLALNATELKTQLAHHGITNATMNFMSNGDNHNQNGTQHQQQEQQQHRFKTYESLTELEFNEEQLSALEIIIPHYA